MVPSPFLCSLFVAAALATQPGPTLEDLGWLVGHWRSSTQDSSSEELWTASAGGTMMGLNRTVKADQTVAFEHLQLVERDDAVVYRAWPGGEGPTEFVATRIATTEAVFEAPEHDFPKRIRYRLEGTQLCARVDDGTDQGRSAEWCWKKVGD